MANMQSVRLQNGGRFTENLTKIANFILEIGSTTYNAIAHVKMADQILHIVRDYEDGGGYALVDPAGNRTLVDNKSVTVGRLPDVNEVIIPDEKISRKHCIIQIGKTAVKNDDPFLVVSDTNSLNGTTVEYNIKSSPEQQLFQSHDVATMARKDVDENGHEWSNQDNYACRLDANVFAVFDGVSDGPDGAKASAIARDVVEGFDFESTGSSVPVERQLQTCLNNASAIIASQPEQNRTTAVLAKIIEENSQKYICYASAGDSRLYIVDQNGNATQITKDEGEGNKIFNMLGSGSRGVTQTGRLPLLSGDRIVLCTDGITGDNNDDCMPVWMLSRIVNLYPTDPAAMLVRQARKDDDKTVIVVSV